MYKHHIEHLSYLIRHKWFVMIECFKEGLYWRGIVHDLSKFLPSEFIPYTKYFYGPTADSTLNERSKTDYYKPTDTGDKAFDFAWLLHQKRNRHHWQWWVLPEDVSGVKVFPIEEPYLTEMICDWIGAGKAKGYFSPGDDRYSEVRRWYRKHGNKLQLADETRRKIEKRIKYE